MKLQREPHFLKSCLLYFFGMLFVFQFRIDVDPMHHNERSPKEKPKRGSRGWLGLCDNAEPCHCECKYMNQYMRIVNNYYLIYKVGLFRLLAEYGNNVRRFSGQPGTSDKSADNAAQLLLRLFLSSRSIYELPV